MGHFLTDEERVGPPVSTFHFLNAAPTQPQRVDWLWPQRLPLASLSLLVGDPGVGKSLLTADLAACLSVPRPWPDDPLAERPDPATLPPLPANPTDDDLERSFPPIRGFNTRRIGPTGAVFVAPEDEAALPDRLAAAGADPLRVCILDGVRRQFTEDMLPLRLPVHSNQLEQAIRALDHPRLVVLDPIHSLLDDGVCCSPDLQAGLVACLTGVTRRRGVAVLAVGHLSKNYARRVLYRIRGSLSLVAAARSVLLLTADPDTPDRRILTQIKSTYGPPAPPLAFRIVAGPKLVWDDTSRPDWRLSTGTLDLSPESFSVLSDACDWLTDLMSTGPRPAREVLSAARAAGVPRATLFRAKRLLNITSRKDGPTWLWLPAVR